MLNFMRAGGINMWLMVVVALLVAVFAALRPRERRARILGLGAAVELALGLLGVSLGLAAVSASYRSFPDPMGALGEGLGELSNNGVLAVGLAAALGLAALVAGRLAENELRA